MGSISFLDIRNELETHIEAWSNSDFPLPDKQLIFILIILLGLM